MQYTLICLKLEKECFIKQIRELESLQNCIRSLRMKKDVEERAKKLIKYYKKKAENTEAEINKFTAFIEGIPDMVVKQMIKMYFIELKSCEEIGEILYLERTTVFKKIKQYYNNFYQTSL